MTRSLWVKICGLSTAEAVSAAVLGGADAIGFVLAPGSPRTVDPETVARLARLAPDGVETVGVFRGQSVDEVLDAATRSGVATVQLHGDEPPEAAATVRAAGFGVIRATSADGYARESPAERESFGDVRLLLDAPDPGAGQTFDAEALLASPPPGDWILAGGLRATNVAALVAALGPTGVDVSSGVESSRGVKDPALIRDFLAAARGLPVTT